MLEAYQAYGDYHTMMELSETLVVECCRAVNVVMGRVLRTVIVHPESRTRAEVSRRRSNG